MKKPTKKSKIFWKKYLLGMLPYSVVVCWGLSLQEARSYLEKHYVVDLLEDEKVGFEVASGKRVGGRCINIRTGGVFIWLDLPPRTVLGISNLAHEAVHAIGFCMERAGIPFTHENDEMIAYGVDFLVAEVLSDIKKLKK